MPTALLVKLYLQYNSLELLTGMKLYQYSTDQGFLQLDDIGSRHDPHLRIIRCHHETFEGHSIHILQTKVKTCIMNVHTTQTPLRER